LTSSPASITFRIRCGSANTPGSCTRVAVQQQQVGPLPFLEGADFLVDAHQLRIGAGGRDDRVHGAHHPGLAGDLSTLRPLHLGQDVRARADSQPLLEGQAKRVVGAGQPLPDLSNHVLRPSSAGLVRRQQLVGDDGRHEVRVIGRQHAIRGLLVEEIGVLDGADARFETVLNRSRAIRMGEHVAPHRAGGLNRRPQLRDGKLDVVQFIRR